MCTHLHFPKLNNICHCSDHLTNLSMSSCSVCYSPISLVFLNSFVSCANFNILPVIPSSKFLMYTNTKIGPVGPYRSLSGTPLETDFQLETSPSTTTICLLSVQCREFQTSSKYSQIALKTHLYLLESQSPSDPRTLTDVCIESLSSKSATSTRPTNRANSADMIK